jgi:putative flippase GtrA
VDLTPTALLAHARTESGRRALRYSATSVVGVVGSQILLQLLSSNTGFGWEPVKANFTAACLMSIPAFLLNKYWVWGKSGRAHLRREVIPFWVFTVAGWILSTVTVDFATNHTDPDTLMRQLTVSAASIGGFGILWVLKYMFLDKIMFGSHHHTPYDEDIELEEAGIDPDTVSDDDADAVSEQTSALDPPKVTKP